MKPVRSCQKPMQMHQRFLLLFEYALLLIHCWRSYCSGNPIEPSFPARRLSSPSCVFPLLLVQHIMVRALTFRWKQPEQILCHSQAFQKDEIYFYHCIHAAWGSFTAAKPGLMLSDNPMYLLIGADNRWGEKRPVVLAALFSSHQQ